MLSILGMGGFHPRYRITNSFIEELGLDTSTQWIMDKIGIEERATTLPLEYIRSTRNQDIKRAVKIASHSATDLAVEAAKIALDRAGVKPNEIGLVICNSCTPSAMSPREGQMIADSLGIVAPSYELMTACPAFALHLDYLGKFREETLPDYILGICTAAMTQRVNYNDRTDCAIWGDGAAAYIISPRKKGKLNVMFSSFAADPSRCDAVAADTFGFFHQDGRAVRDFSVRQTVRMLKSLEERFELDWTKDFFVGHQANATMLDQITNNRHIPSSQHWQNVRFLGNQAAAGAPAVLAEHWDEMRKDTRIAVAVLGAGLSWGSLLFQVDS